MGEPKKSLERADWYVAITRKIISDQRALVEALQEAGRATTLAENTLDALICSLKILEDHERALRSEIEQDAMLRGEIIGRRYAFR